MAEEREAFGDFVYRTGPADRRRRIRLWLSQAAMHLTMAQEDMEELGEAWPAELQEAHAAIRRCLEARETER